MIYRFNRLRPWQIAGSVTALLLLMAGCGPSEEALRLQRQQAIQNGIQQANTFSAQGQYANAIAHLEALNQRYSNDPDLIEAIAFLHNEAGDPGLAGFYFEQVVRIDPERADRLAFAGQAYWEGGDADSTARVYTAYLENNPSHASAWKTLALAHQAMNRPKPAVDALLQIRRVRGDLDAREEAMLGDLYLQLGNTAQSEQAYNRALKLPDTDSAHVDALIGRLYFTYQRQQWDEAEALIERIDALDKTRLDASPMAPARSELARWRKAQKELETKLAAEITRPDTTETVTESEATEEEVLVVIEDEEGDASGETVVATVTREVETDAEASETEATETTEVDETVVVMSEETDVRPTTRVETGPAATSTLAQARQAQREGRHQEAVALFLKALTENDASPEGWDGLAQSYLALDKPRQAEFMALEAIRRAPDQPVYTLRYLTIVQAHRSADHTMRELTRAKERYPENPEITLALARGYNRLQNNPRNARFLYREFIALSPNHPERAQAEAEMAALPR